jgi:hypothetical protein
MTLSQDIRFLSDRSASRRQKTADEIFDAYLAWRLACFEVWDAHASWAAAGKSEAALEFLAYSTALDAEERAAETYSELFAQAGDLADTIRERVTGPSTVSAPLTGSRAEA